MKEEKRTFSQESVDFYDANNDQKFNDKLFDTIRQVIFDKDGKGDTRKVLCAFAEITASLLKTFSSMSGYEQTDDLFDAYADLLYMCTTIKDLEHIE